MRANPLILTAQDKPDRQLMGGKAFALARLNLKFPVPAWFVITPQAFNKGQVHENLLPFIQEKLAILGTNLYAVRSSAVDEDGSDHSFAGQLQSFLNVTAENVLQMVERVWQSAQTESVLAYRQQHGLRENQQGTAILVQAMVPATQAGVLFTANPTSTDPEEMVINAVSGLAEQLVQGQQNGDFYRLKRSGEILEQQSVYENTVLAIQKIEQLRQLGLAIEQHFGQPQDIEWAFVNSELFLLQARPITALTVPNEAIIWDNSNIVESYSGVTSPLTFSFARYVYAEVYQAFMRLLGVSKNTVQQNKSLFDHMLGHLNGHVYYHLLNWYRALALLPGYAYNSGFMESMMGTKVPIPAHIAHLISGQKNQENAYIDSLRVLRTAIGLLWHAFRLPVTRKRFYQRLNKIFEQAPKDLNDLSLVDLIAYYGRLENELLAKWDAPLINDFICMIAFGASQKLLKKWCGKSQGPALHNDMMIGQGDIISAEPAKRIQEMADLIRHDFQIVDALCQGNLNILKDNSKLENLVAAYIAKFGDRCTQELKLESQTLSDNPTSLLHAIGYTALRSPSVTQGQDSLPDTKLKELLSRHWLKYHVAKWLIHWAKARVRDRENLRFERTRIFGLVRRIFRAIGQKLQVAKIIQNSQDVFYLTVEETLSAAETGINNLSELVKQRQQQAEEWQNMPPLPNRFTTQGIPTSTIILNRPLEKINIEDKAMRQGLGCCRGIVRAQARVIRDPRRESIQAGEILVAAHTDPGWIALFSNAAGIIVERGSLLSHSAIVAREMGIPAIVAVAGLMEWLQTGDWIEMDGTSGLITRIDNAN